MTCLNFIRCVFGCSIKKHTPPECVPREVTENLRDQLIVAEYNNVREALLKNIELTDKSEIFYLSASVAVIAFLIDQHNRLSSFGPIVNVIYLLPFLISLSGLLRYRGLDRVVGIYNSYLCCLEKKYASPINFTHFFQEKNYHRLHYLRLLPYQIINFSTTLFAMIAINSSNLTISWKSPNLAGPIISDTVLLFAFCGFLFFSICALFSIFKINCKT